MRQTTSNRSAREDSCARGWRLLGLVAAFFACSDTLRPYLEKYLETTAQDPRRAHRGTYVRRRGLAESAAQGAGTWRGVGGRQGQGGKSVTCCSITLILLCRDVDS